MIHQSAPAGAPGHRGGVAARRAIVFAAVLVVVGATAVALRVLQVGFHPQILLFLYSIPANSAISVFSHEIALLDYGSHQPLLLSTLSATLGTLAAGYLDWQVFVPLLDSRSLSGYRRNRVYRWCIDHFSRGPFVALLVAAFTPIPFFPFKFLAFSVRYPLRRYLAAVALARAPRYFLLAWIGSRCFIPGWILAVALAVTFIPAVLARPGAGGPFRPETRE